ncbi:MAG: hypothetical protein HZA16_03615 [Nitrospirae bacterium]|nr:hypothetical protein [Nitrospirota bacterium]
MKNLICYCFGYTDADIMKDVRENQGRSLIIERILSEKKKGACNCAETNLLGR